MTEPTVWAVCFGSYFPREVESLWPTREEAEAEVDRLYEEDVDSGPWEVSPMAIGRGGGDG